MGISFKVSTIAIVRLIFLFLVINVVLWGSASRGYCLDTDNIWVIENENPGGSSYDLTEFGKQVGEIYNMVLNIATPCAIVSFAFGAFKLLRGDEKSMSAGKRQMELALIALAVLLLLPLAVREGIDVGKLYGWSPP